MNYDVARCCRSSGIGWWAKTMNLLSTLDPAADAPLEALLSGARRVVTVSAGIQPGETVVVVTDPERPRDVAAALVRAIEKVGAIPVLIVMPNVPSGAEPPRPVAAAIAASDVILAPTSGALYHTEAVHRALAAGARFLAMTGFTKDVLVRGGVFADFPALAPRAIRLAELLTIAHEAHVVAPGGTDLRVRLDGRQGIPVTGMVREPGQRDACPDIEAFIAPLEASAEGVIVADASASLVGVLDQPLTIVVEHGRATAIHGGKAADLIRQVLDAAGGGDAYTLAELAFGLNPAGIIRGVIVEDEGVAGTGHVALGRNVSFGGISAAPIHLDFVFYRPTLWLDDRLIIRDGEMIVPS